MPLDAPTFRERAHAVMQEIQSSICGGIEALEQELGSEAVFQTDAWTRPGGGGGVTRVLAEGAFLEKGGVNVSAVHGELEEGFAGRFPGSGRDFSATGVSLVLHPRNPYVPTVHANFRYLERGNRRWFGGGADLTPYYLFEEDCNHFHATWEGLCREHPAVADYDRFRRWCDHYFYLPHRGEARGIGGIFFDYLHVDETRGGHDEALLAFVREGGLRFLDAYLPIVTRHVRRPYGDAERAWQEERRGRYVEFNLLYDRGTVFGLRTGGRVESILMSLPPRVRFLYGAVPVPGSPEQILLDRLRQPRPPAPAGVDEAGG